MGKRKNYCIKVKENDFEKYWVKCFEQFYKSWLRAVVFELVCVSCVISLGAGELRNCIHREIDSQRE